MNFLLSLHQKRKHSQFFPHIQPVWELRNYATVLRKRCLVIYSFMRRLELHTARKSEEKVHIFKSGYNYNETNVGTYSYTHETCGNAFPAPLHPWM